MIEPSVEAKAAAYNELIRPRCRQAVADKRESDKALTAAYCIDAPAIHAAGVAEGRAAMRDEIVEWTRSKRACDAVAADHRWAALSHATADALADAIEAAFPTTGEKTDG